MQFAICTLWPELKVPVQGRPLLSWVRFTLHQHSFISHRHCIVRFPHPLLPTSSWGTWLVTVKIGGRGKNKLASVKVTLVLVSNWQTSVERRAKNLNLNLKRFTVLFCNPLSSPGYRRRKIIGLSNDSCSMRISLFMNKNKWKTSTYENCPRRT